MGAATWKVLVEFMDGTIEAYSTSDPVGSLQRYDMKVVREFSIRHVGSE